uniref:Ig-like domain-containing protein n=1 Tax=Chelonoidis abingdonii TaxID=106734 RepID=A0A8C0QP37_CHEAB
AAGLATGMLLWALLALLLQASCPLASCPPQCVCDTRPWFTPQSVYRQARTVDCNNLLLTLVPSGLAPDTQLLLLQSNEIARLSGELRRLPSLTELDLSQNRCQPAPRRPGQPAPPPHPLAGGEPAGGAARALPAGAGGSGELYLNHNRLQTVDPRWFLPLPRLEILMIGENPIAQLEVGGFRPLARLHSLVLAGLGLQDLPGEAFQRLAELESLSLFRNRLAWVPAPALHRLPLLKFLDLNENPIGELQAGVFWGTPRLEELSLSTLEQLTGVAEGAFDGLPQLAKLDLSHNPRLAYLHPAALHGALALRTLLATDGALALLPAQLLASLLSLAALSLRGNPLCCDCLAAWQGLARLRLVEPGVTLSSGTGCRGTAGRPLREGLQGGGGRGCPLAFPPRGWPERLVVAPSGSVTLSCPANAKSPPEISWLGPAGERLPSSGRAGGALELVGVGLAHTGQYTCVAQNEAGSASCVLMLQVLGGAGWREEGSERELGGRGGPALLRKKVQPNFVVLEWTGGGWSPWGPPWASLAPHYTARVSLDSRQVNLMHLQPATGCEICLSTQWACLNVTTAGLGPAGRGPGGAALAAVTGSLLVALCAMLLACYASRRLRELGCRAALKPYRQPPAALLLGKLYPPIISLGEPWIPPSAAGAPHSTEPDTSRP